MTFALLTTPIIGGCAHRTIPIAVTAKSNSEPVVCSAFHPLKFSQHDTDLTIEQVKEFDAAWRKLCPQSR